MPAGYPLSGILKLRRRVGGGAWSDVTSASMVPSTRWYLNFVDDNNNAQHSCPIDWAGISSSNPWVVLSLSGEDTLKLRGKVLHLEVSNADGVSDLITPPSDYFNFVPNKIPPMTKTVTTI